MPPPSRRLLEYLTGASSHLSGIGCAGAERAAAPTQPTQARQPPETRARPVPPRRFAALWLEQPPVAQPERCPVTRQRAPTDAPPGWGGVRRRYAKWTVLTATHTLDWRVAGEGVGGGGLFVFVPR
jgi:hypothetical protein